MSHVPPQTSEPDPTSLKVHPRLIPTLFGLVLLVSTLSTNVPHLPPLIPALTTPVVSLRLARLFTLLGFPMVATRIYHPITHAPPRPCSRLMPRISDYRPHPAVPPCPSFPIVPTIPTIPTIFCRASDTFANAGVYAQGVSSGLVASAHWGGLDALEAGMPRRPSPPPL